MTFSPEVYEQIREGAKRSAAVIVPLACELAQPRTVVDVGCGEGWFAREFASFGCDVVAVDEVCPSPGTVLYRKGSVEFRRGDLHDGDAWACALHDRPFDLTVCLEVAEHLSAGAADAFVATLCALAPIVLFSAAIPGQTGHGHVNCQWPAYWCERFERHGFEVSGEIRWRIWNDDRVEPWYRQNLLVAADRRRVDPDVWNYLGNELFGPEAFDEPVAVVHPDIWAWLLPESAKR